VAEIDLTGAQPDAALAVAALKDGHLLSPVDARALGQALADRTLTDAELGAFGMVLALRPPGMETLAHIAAGLTNGAPPRVAGRVAWIADDAPTGCARLAVERRVRAQALDVVAVGPPPAFDRVAHAAGAASPTLEALRALHGARLAGAGALLLDLHLSGAFDLEAAETTAAATCELADRFGIVTTVRVFRFKAPLGQTFGAMLEPGEARAVASGGGPIPMRAFVSSTIDDVAALAGAETTEPTPVTGLTPEILDAPIRRELRAPADGTVLRLEPNTLTALSRLVGGIRLHCAVGDTVTRGDVVLEVLGTDSASVDRVAEAIAGAWMVGAGHVPPASAQPVARFAPGVTPLRRSNPD